MARARKQDHRQQDLRQGAGPEGQRKDSDLILRADVGRGLSETVRSLFRILFLPSGDSPWSCSSYRGGRRKGRKERAFEGRIHRLWG